MYPERRHRGAVLWSVALHIAVVAAVIIGVPWQTERPPPAAAVAAPIIEGTIVDTATLERERNAREEVARVERQRQQREERQRREAAEQQRQTEERERQRVAAETRAREEAAKKEADRIAAEKAEQTRRDEAARVERERQERERQEAERKARAEAEQRRRQQQAEAELQEQLALEAERNAARDAGLYDQYLRMLKSKIQQHWDRPLSARPGVDCVVQVVQLPTGDVVSARVTSCNGDDAVRRSIERAVMDASPLPRPPNPTLFERNLNVRFQPDA